MYQVTLRLNTRWWVLGSYIKRWQKFCVPFIILHWFLVQNLVWHLCLICFQVFCLYLCQALQLSFCCSLQQALWWHSCWVLHWDLHGILCSNSCWVSHKCPLKTTPCPLWGGRWDSSMVSLLTLWLLGSTLLDSWKFVLLVLHWYLISLTCCCWTPCWKT